MSEENKRGRGLKPPRVGRKHAMFRLSEPVHARVWAAAKAHGRSLSEELEHRINQSLLMDDVVTAAAAAASTAVRDAFAAERRAAAPVEPHFDIRQAAPGLGALGPAVLRHLRIETEMHHKPINQFGRIDSGY